MTVRVRIRGPSTVERLTRALERSQSTAQNAKVRAKAHSDRAARLQAEVWVWRRRALDAEERATIAERELDDAHERLGRVAAERDRALGVISAVREITRQEP